jgi:hypothetical protein
MKLSIIYVDGKKLVKVVDPDTGGTHVLDREAILHNISMIKTRLVEEKDTINDFTETLMHCAIQNLEDWLQYFDANN